MKFKYRVGTRVKIEHNGIITGFVISKLDLSFFEFELPQYLIKTDEPIYILPMEYSTKNISGHIISCCELWMTRINKKHNEN
jgi:hypothetical protein